MKYALASVVLAMLPSLCASIAESPHELELRLVATKKTQLVGEAPDVHLFLVNRSTVPIYVDKGFLTTSIEMRRNDKWEDCGQMSRGTPGVRTEPRWDRVGPGAELLIGIGSYWCPEDAGPISRKKDWTEIPGEYQLKVEVSHRILAHAVERVGPPPGEAADWTLQSNIVGVSVEEPQGIDGKAFRWARRHGYHPLSVEVANEFPSSRYGALVVWKSLSIVDGDPSQIAEYLDKGFYPGRGSVPDPSSPDGQRIIDAGEDMARWRIEQGERLLLEKRTSPYDRDVRLSVAVSYTAIGEKDKATRLLEALASDTGTPESEWAERFLIVQGWR